MQTEGAGMLYAKRQLWMVVFLCWFISALISFAGENLEKLAGLDRRGLENVVIKGKVIDVSKVTELINCNIPALRRNTYACVWGFAKLTNDIDRLKAVQLLSQGLLDESLTVRTEVERWLRDFEPSDFSIVSRQNIRAMLQRKTLSKDMILLGGIADIDAIMHDVRGFAKGAVREPGAGRWYGTKEWASRMVLARSGDKEAMRDILKYVEQETNLVIRITVLLDDVAYTRQTEGVELLNRYLNSDERLPSVKDSAPGSLVCQRAAAVLAKMISDFPVRKDYYADYSDRDIVECRQWMATMKLSGNGQSPALKEVTSGRAVKSN